MYNRKRYEEAKRNHLCYECGAKDNRTVAGRILCQSCADRKIQTQAYRNTVRKRQHRCINCGKQDAATLAGHVRCVACASRNAESCKRWKARCRS